MVAVDSVSCTFFLFTHMELGCGREATIGRVLGARGRASGSHGGAIGRRIGGVAGTKLPVQTVLAIRKGFLRGGFVHATDGVGTNVGTRAAAALATGVGERVTPQKVFALERAILGTEFKNAEI